ncbi:Immunoglobulin super DCC subclass member 3, partial [Branchiostoma belcheri]
DRGQPWGSGVTDPKQPTSSEVMTLCSPLLAADTDPTDTPTNVTKHNLFGEEEFKGNPRRRTPPIVYTWTRYCRLVIVTRPPHFLLIVTREYRTGPPAALTWSVTDRAVYGYGYIITGETTLASRDRAVRYCRDADTVGYFRYQPGIADTASYLQYSQSLPIEGRPQAEIRVPGQRSVEQLYNKTDSRQLPNRMPHATSVALVLALLPVISARYTSGGSSIARRSIPHVNNCVNGTYMSDQGRCVRDCGPGLFGEGLSRYCRPCEGNCKTCFQSGTTCTSCREPLYLKDNRCVEDCLPLLTRGPPKQRLRLIGGNSQFEGRVEILHEGVWGTICDDAWDLPDARVVCKELEMGDAVAATVRSAFPVASPDVPMLLDDVECHGDESQLDFCGHREWGKHNCGHSEEAGVRCSGPDLSRQCVSECGDGFYRVPDTNQCELCAPECLTCYADARRCMSCDSPRFLEDHTCVEDCVPGYYGNTLTRMCEPCASNCRLCKNGHVDNYCISCHEGMFLQGHQCVTSCEPQLAKQAVLRLVGGTTVFEGRVEVKYGGEWGTVCDDSWDIRDADVVCRELGFGRALSAVRSAGYGAGKGQIWMDNVSCRGDERELFHCLQREFGVNDCNHHEDAGVQCSGPAAGGETGTCVDTCGVGYYLRGEAECVPCTSNCLDCLESEEVCTRCKAPMFLQRDGRCVMDCGLTEFGLISEGKCQPCNLEVCGRCANGESDSNCTECPADKVLKDWSCEPTCGPDMFLLNQTCVSDCGQGRYGNPNGFRCEPCPADCLTCEFSSAQLVCTSCKAPKVFHNQRCLTMCPSGTYAAMMDTSQSNMYAAIRLAGGGSQLEGRIEILHEGHWGTVCNDFFDLDAATVACRQMNLGAAVGLIDLESEDIEPGQGPIWLDNVMCNGNEQRLEDCYRQEWGENNCNHNKDVAIRCEGPGVRECQPSCPDGYYGNALDHTCQRCFANCLTCAGTSFTCDRCKPGFYNNGTTCVSSCGHGFHARDGDGTCQPCSDSCASCEGAADQCTSCPDDMYLQGSTCVASCSEYQLAQYDRVRLVGGRTPFEGRVEVKYGGIYGTVCDDKFGFSEAEVICQELQLGTALEAVGEAVFGQGSGQIWLDELECSGNESSVFHCGHNGWGVSDCRHSEDAGVRCSGPDKSRVCVTSAECSDGYFVSVDGKSCGKCSFNCLRCQGDPDHCIACSEGQFLNPDMNRCVDYCLQGYYGDQATGTCKKCSSQCADCRDSPTTCIQCPAPKYLSMENTCVDNCGSGFIMRGSDEIRLVNGSSIFEGRVEVFHDGVWGTVCDDTWDMHDVTVVCRQLSMGNAVAAYSGGRFGAGQGPIWLDDVECLGSERTLLECPKHSAGLGHGDCQHTEDAAVRCSGPDSSQQCVASCGQGYFPGPDRICQHCAAACSTCETSKERCTSCADPLFLDGTTCVAHCPDGYYGDILQRRCLPCHSSCLSCYSADNNAVCRQCKPGFALWDYTCVEECAPWEGWEVLSQVLPARPTSPVVRLTSGASSTEGRVEVLHDGRWGTVCHDEWDLHDAEVVCQELGLGRAVQALRSSRFGRASADMPVWMDDVACIGHEQSLTFCRQKGWGQGNCDSGHTEDAGVICDGSPYQHPPLNLCRQTEPSHCHGDSCYPGVNCVEVIRGGATSSVCLGCPDGQVGDGTNCTVVATFLPEFKLRPSNRTARLGFAANMACQAAGDPAPSVTVDNWFKNGRPLPAADVTSGRVSVLRNGNLHFSRTHREDSGEYTCLLRNTRGTARVSATLTIEEKPEVVSVKPGVAVVGSRACLQCVIAGLPESNVTWQRNSHQLEENRYTSYDENGTLYIDNVQQADSGEYRCIAENILGSDFASVPLTVQVPPRYTQEPVNVTVDEDGTALIPCVVTGSPNPQVLWKKDGDNLPTTNRFAVQAQGLQVLNVKRSDMGTYSCIALNDVMIVSKFAQLLVRGPPHITLGPLSYNLSTGEAIKLQCETIGVLTPTITWLKDGIEVPVDSRHVRLPGGGLQLIRVGLSEAGLYTCLAQNRFGKDQASAVINVSGPPLPEDASHSGVIAGVIIAVLAVFLFVGAVLIFRYLRNRKSPYTIKMPEKLRNFRFPSRNTHSIALDQTVAFLGESVELDTKHPESYPDQQPIYVPDPGPQNKYVKL